MNGRARPPRPSAEPLLLRPENPAHGGSVVARDADGKAIFVFQSLPGELVEAEPRGRMGGVPFARTIRVVEPSADRVQARCPHFGECGGCQWQHAAYDLQLAIKRRVVEDAWSRAGLRLPPDTPVRGMDDPWRYRIRGEFEAVDGPEGLAFGFHRMRSHRVLPISTCPIHDERIERGMLAFAQACREHRVEGLQNLLLTVEPGGRGLLWQARFHAAPKKRLGAAVVARAAELLPDLVLLDDSMTLEFWGLVFRVRSDTFVQTNHQQMQVLYREALDMLGDVSGESVLDLYSGIGTISLAIARTAASVTGVEENPHAVRLAQLAARINGFDSVRHLQGRTEMALRGIRSGEHAACVLDPPRAGCDPAALAELLRIRPRRIVYVSCDPVTHARDLAQLVAGGYRVRRAAIVDMFPQTFHIESAALVETAE